MIFWCTLFSVLMAPGNLCLFFAILIFGVPHLNPKLLLPQKLFILWLVWAFWCSVTSQFPVQSMFGSLIRAEGWLMWLIMARLAWHYWATQEDVGALAFGCIICMCVVGLMALAFGGNPISDMQLSGFSALSFVLLWSMRPDISILALPTLFLANNRSAFIAVIAGVFVNELFKRNLMKSLANMTGVALGLAVLIPFTPLASKIASLNVASFGFGARSDLLMQAYDLSFKMPYHGLGLDTLGNYFQKNSAMRRQQSGIPDSAHNIIYDIILQTGHIGYLIALLCLGACIGITVKFKTERNIACLSMVSACVAFSLFNPGGPAAHILALVGVFGFSNEDRD